MNEERIIKVKTNVGITEEEETGEGLGQGTVEDAPLSTANLDKGVDEYFGDNVKLAMEE